MSNHATLYVTSAEKDGEGEPILDPERVQVEFDEDDGTRECEYCHEQVESVPVKGANGKSTDTWQHANDEKVECDPDLVAMHNLNYDLEEDGQTKASPISLGCADFCNSASVNFDEDEMAVTVNISVGDPRGAFAMTVRRMGDGRLILHVPYEGEPMPHMPLKKLHEGTYEIVGGS